MPAAPETAQCFFRPSHSRKIYKFSVASRITFGRFSAWMGTGGAFTQGVMEVQRHGAGVAGCAAVPLRLPRRACLPTACLPANSVPGPATPAHQLFPESLANEGFMAVNSGTTTCQVGSTPGPGWAPGSSLEAQCASSPP